MFMHMAVHRFPDVKYVIHVDDDTLVRVSHLVQFLRKVERRHRNAVRLGAPGLRSDRLNGGRRRGQFGPLQPGQGPVRLMGHVFTHEIKHGPFCGGPLVIYSRALLRMAAVANFNWTRCVEDAASREARLFDDMLTGFCFRQAVGVLCSDEGEEEIIRFGDFEHEQKRLSEELLLEASSTAVAMHKVTGNCFEVLYDGLPDAAEVCDLAAGF